MNSTVAQLDDYRDAPHHFGGSVDTIIHAFLEQTRRLLDVNNRPPDLPRVKATLLPFELVSEDDATRGWADRPHRVVLIGRHGNTNQHRLKLYITALHVTPTGDALNSRQWAHDPKETCRMILQKRPEPDNDAIYVGPCDLKPLINATGAVACDVLMPYRLKIWASPKGRLTHTMPLF